MSRAAQPSLSTLVARVGRILRGGFHTPWSPAEIAGLAGIELKQAAWACRQLVAGKCAVRVSANRRRGCLYQWIQGSVVPEDARGRHASHPKGQAWAIKRKQRAALQKARARKAAKRVGDGSIAALLVVGRGR